MFRVLTQTFAWLAICMSPALVRAEAPTAEENDLFLKQVQPLLKARCVKCHGGEKTEAGLKLTSRAALLTGGDSGPAAVAGAADESLLLQVVGYEADTQMPPDAKLTDAEIAALRRWIDSALPWPSAK